VCIVLEPCSHTWWWS